MLVLCRNESAMTYFPGYLVCVCKTFDPRKGQVPRSDWSNIIARTNACIKGASVYTVKIPHPRPDAVRSFHHKFLPVTW
jgi:hypothetical protein